MPISGLLLTLSRNTDLQRSVLAALATRPELQPGALVEHWLPIALDVSDDAQGREVHDWLLELPGVEYVDVVYVNFEPLPVARESGNPAGVAKLQPAGQETQP